MTGNLCPCAASPTSSQPSRTRRRGGRTSDAAIASEAPTDASSAVAPRVRPGERTHHVPVQYKGGGTTRVDLLKLDVTPPATAVDNTRIEDPAMRRISRTDGPHIGSPVSMAQLQIRRSLVREGVVATTIEFSAVARQARECGNYLGRVANTVVGDLDYVGACSVRFAPPAAETLPYGRVTGTAASPRTQRLAVAPPIFDHVDVVTS